MHSNGNSEKAQVGNAYVQVCFFFFLADQGYQGLFEQRREGNPWHHVKALMQIQGAVV